MNMSSQNIDEKLYNSLSPIVSYPLATDDDSNTEFLQNHDLFPMPHHQTCSLLSQDMTSSPFPMELEVEEMMIRAIIIMKIQVRDGVSQGRSPCGFSVREAQVTEELAG
ncbi:hypothetical protein Gogos_013269 [Gossypium gossypioides]|uniref:Uncharacterized protein n=1 Tax=Gossypium gossypioides TaxID=34282 RepID=A0A7J9BV55_GOSGO|nr:hypothetical protein [Gossypium gossypioides]